MAPWDQSVPTGFRKRPYWEPKVPPSAALLLPYPNRAGAPTLVRMHPLLSAARLARLIMPEPSPPLRPALFLTAFDAPLLPAALRSALHRSHTHP